MEASMNLKLVMAASLIAAFPVIAQAQGNNGPPANAPKPTTADVQKLVQTIAADKAKVQAYCEMGKVLAQMDQAEQKKDTKATKALGDKADNLAKQLGPDYSRIMDGLNSVDPGSAEGKRYGALFAPLYQQCK
jgi:putative intracellular protease/amidase